MNEKLESLLKQINEMFPEAKEVTISVVEGVRITVIRDDRCFMMYLGKGG